MSVKLALIGHPVSHSLSPPMHRAAFSFFGIEGNYELVDIEPARLSGGIESLKNRGFSGFNVTIPHKEAVFALLKNHSPTACLAGALNTVRIDSAGELWAHNTDVGGFLLALSLALKRAGNSRDEARAGEAVSCLAELCGLTEPYLQNLAAGKKALVLGAGGAARACLAALLAAGCRNIVVAARRQQQAEQICRSLHSCFSKYARIDEKEISLLPAKDVEGSGIFDLVVNCTPAGLSRDDDTSWFTPLIAAMDRQALLFDSVYMRDRRATLLMKMAAANGLRAVDGLDMLVEQAALSFEYWTGRRPPAEIMRQALL